MRNLGIDPRSRASSTMDLGDSCRIEALALNERRERRLGAGAEAEVGEWRTGERSRVDGGGMPHVSAQRGGRWAARGRRACVQVCGVEGGRWAALGCVVGEALGHAGIRLKGSFFFFYSNKSDANFFSCYAVRSLARECFGSLFR